MVPEAGSRAEMLLALLPALLGDDAKITWCTES
jgi:hypothetical protein